MKKNILLGSLFSALLFTVAAIPASASPTAKPVDLNNNVKFQISEAVAKPAIDLIGLAKQYAPDTVKDWEEVLAKQTKQFVKVGNLSHSVTVMKLDESTMKDAKQVMIKEVVPAPVGNGQQGKGIVIATPITASAAVVSGSTKENQLFTNLTKAVEEKDSEAIKTNLAKLLEQFKSQAKAAEQAAAK